MSGPKSGPVATMQSAGTASGLTPLSPMWPRHGRFRTLSGLRANRYPRNKRTWRSATRRPACTLHAGRPVSPRAATGNLSHFITHVDMILRFWPEPQPNRSVLAEASIGWLMSSYSRTYTTSQHEPTWHGSCSLEADGIMPHPGTSLNWPHRRNCGPEFELHFGCRARSIVRYSALGVAGFSRKQYPRRPAQVIHPLPLAVTPQHRTESRCTPPRPERTATATAWPAPARQLIPTSQWHPAAAQAHSRPTHLSNPGDLGPLNP